MFLIFQFLFAMYLRKLDFCEKSLKESFQGVIFLFAVFQCVGMWWWGGRDIYTESVQEELFRVNFK